jgi:hypothetical protein
MKGCDHLRAGAFGGGVKEPHSSCINLPFGLLFYSLYLSSLASFLVRVLEVTVTLLKRLTLQSDVSVIRVGKYNSRKIMRSLEGRRPAQSSLRHCDCGGEAPSRKALIVIELDISLRHVQEDYTSCDDVMAIERPKIHLMDQVMT